MNVNKHVSCNLGGNNTAFVNVFDALIHSEFFNNYAPMYDQFRIDKVKAKFTSLQYPTANGNGTSVNLSVVTGFDRNGFDKSQFNEVINAGGESLFICNIGENIATYSSSVTKNLAFGSPFEIIRYINPSTIQEKSQFIATDSLRYWYTNYNEQTNTYHYLNTEVENCKPENPCYPIRNDAVPFKPTYLIGVLQSSNQLQGPCIFNCELDVCVTFRGLRKSSTV